MTITVPAGWASLGFTILYSKSKHWREFLTGGAVLCAVSVVKPRIKFNIPLQLLKLGDVLLPTLRPSQSTWAVSPPKIDSYHPHPPSPLLLLLSP